MKLIFGNNNQNNFNARKEIYKNKCEEDLDFDCMTRQSQVFYKTWYLAELWTKLRLLSLNRYWCWFVFCLLKDKNQVNASQNPTLLQLPDHWSPPSCNIINYSEHQLRMKYLGLGWGWSRVVLSVKISTKTLWRPETSPCHPDRARPGWNLQLKYEEMRRDIPDYAWPAGSQYQAWLLRRQS